ncbi:hypothetical protein BBJ28_00022992, partial [Nothophytophthora sp. Chile5]
EDENERLKERLKLLVQTSGALQTALTVANAHRCHFTDTTTTARALHLQLGTGQWLGCADVFDVLEYRVNARSHELETIFRESHRPLTGADTNDVHIRHDAEELSAAAAVEFKLARLLPFHETTASDVMWEMIELGAAQDEFVSCSTKRSEDVIANVDRFRIPMEGGKTVTLDIHGVTKRFEVPGGLIILLESAVEWSTASSSWGHSTRASGWVIVRRYPTGGGVIAEDMTPCACQLRSIIRLKPRKIEEDGAKATESLLSRTVSDVVIPSFRKMLGSRLQCMENMLLDSIKTVGI